MRDIEPPFEVFFEGNTVRVSEHELKGKRIFHIDFGGRKKPLVLTVAMNRKDEKFWTSIPEGRQNEAEQIGKLIAVHIRSKNK